MRISAGWNPESGGFGWTTMVLTKATDDAVEVGVELGPPGLEPGTNRL
jgi:hypothetical protein